jgi:hypothetical protein
MAAAQEARNAHLRQNDSRISTHVAKAALYPLNKFALSSQRKNRLKRAHRTPDG